MGPLHGTQSFPSARQLWGQTLQLLKMESRQRLQALSTLGCETQPDNAMVARVPFPDHQADFVGSIDETDHAVMS